MKEYMTIAHYKNHSGKVYAFDKLDGSNVRAEWDHRKGFWKFGSRRRLLDENDPLLGEAKQLIKNTEPYFNHIFKRQRYQKVICFFEYLGEHSMFGQHTKEIHEVKLIDVSVYKQGLMTPQEFLKLFGDSGFEARLLYRGEVTKDFVDSVKDSTLEGMTFEGVVCKGAERPKKFSYPMMFKIKSDAWLKQLKEYCKGNIGMFDKLR